MGAVPGTNVESCSTLEPGTGSAFFRGKDSGYKIALPRPLPLSSSVTVLTPSMANDLTLEAMSTSSLMVGGRELQAIFALMADPGAQIATIQFGVGSFNQGASVWVNQLETSFYRSGDRTTFGGPVPVELMRFVVE